MTTTIQRTTPAAETRHQFWRRREARRNVRLEEARLWIIEHACDRPRLKDAAKVAGMKSVALFANLFKLRFGETPKGVANRYMIAAAKRHLADGLLPARVGTLCGFGFPSQFNDRFYQLVGQRPGEWQRQHRNLAA